MQRNSLVVLILFVFLASATLVVSSAQTPGAAPSSQDTKSDQSSQADQAVYDSSVVVRATTHLVLVDVVARDKNGEPVTDLASDDFKILENGKPQNIKVFAFQRPETAAQNLPPLGPNVFTNVPRHKYNGALNVILMDGINTGFEDTAAMRMNTLDFLHMLSRDEPVAIYGLNRKLELLRDFTTGVAPLERAAKKRKKGTVSESSSPGAVQEATESEDKIENFMAWYPPPPIPCLRVQITLKALHWIARSLSGYPGRKNLIWISDGFPFGIHTELSEVTDTCLSRFTGEMSETAQTILDNQIAVYPVVAAGLEIVSNPVGIVTNNELASKTGGVAYHNRNDLDMAIRNGIDDGSTYYVLGYYPADKNWNGAFRNIKVKVERPGVQLRHRSGYFATNSGPVHDLKPSQRGRSMSEALALEAPTASSVLFEATFVPPSHETSKKALVKFAIDPHGLAFDTPADEIEHASVDCVVRVYSLKGAIVNTSSSTMNAKLTPETYRKVMQNSFPCQQSLDLPPGGYLLRLGVIDNTTGLLGTAGGKITVF